MVGHPNAKINTRFILFSPFMSVIRGGSSRQRQLCPFERGWRMPVSAGDLIEGPAGTDRFAVRLENFAGNTRTWMHFGKFLEALTPAQESRLRNC